MTLKKPKSPTSYDLAEPGELPPLTHGASNAVVETATQEEVCTFFDTSRGHLARAGVAVWKTRGSGGSWWRASVPVDGGLTDIYLDSRATAAPRELSSLLLGVRGGMRLNAVLTVSTARVQHSLVGPEGERLLDVSDERMRASTPGFDDEMSWRQVSISPDGDPVLGKQFAKRLRNAGAKPQANGTRPVRGDLERPRRKRLAGLIDDYIQAQFDEIARQDLGLRHDLDVVHPYRVAIRRVRSTLHTFADCFDAAAVELLDSELAWLAGQLGQLRDIDVQRARIADLLSGLPPAVDGPHASAVDDLLAAERAAAAKSVRGNLDGRRYAALVDLIETWRAEPPFTEKAARRRKSAADDIRRAEKRLRNRLQTAAKSGLDEDFHRARKAAKRLRYAAELAGPVLGKAAKPTRQDAKGWQVALGELQDSAITAARLVTLGTTADAQTGGHGFAYGVLAAREWAAAGEIRDSIRAGR